jgi:hypothetical protein
MLAAVAASTLAAVPRGRFGPSGAPLAPEREETVEHKVFLLAGQANVAGRGNAAHLTVEDASRLAKDR